MTTDGHSDPDLLDLDALPDTATGMRPADVAGLIKGVHGLSRWAKRVHKERKDAAQDAEDMRREIWRLGLWILGAVVSGVIAMVGATATAALYVGARMERVEALGARVATLEERAWAGAGHTKRPTDDGGE